MEDERDDAGLGALALARERLAAVETLAATEVAEAVRAAGAHVAARESPDRFAAELRAEMAQWRHLD